MALAAMRSMAPGSAVMQAIAARRTRWLFEHSVAEAAARITSQANLWADLGSRGAVAEMVQQARALGLTARRVELPADWRATVGLLQGPEGVGYGDELVSWG